MINLSLYIKWRIFEFHENYIKLLLISMWNYDKLLFVRFSHIELMKSFYDVDDVNVINYKIDKIRLQWQWLWVVLRHFVKFSYVYHYFVFDVDDNFILYHENKEIERRRLNDSCHFVVFVYFIENNVDDFSIFDVNWIHFDRFQLCVRFQRNRHLLILKYINDSFLIVSNCWENIYYFRYSIDYIQFVVNDNVVE